MKPEEVCRSLSHSMQGLFDCAPLPSGAMRIRTPMLYPDGGLVDVYIQEVDYGYLVTDYGDALGWLYMQSAGGNLSPKQRSLLDDVLLTQGVRLENRELKILCPDSDSLSEAVHLVAQTVVRVADLWFTFRSRRGESIADEVEEWLKHRPYQYERGVTQSGQSGREWKVDYQVRAGSHQSFVFLLSSGSRAAARQISAQVVAGCFDLLPYAKTYRASLVSLFDDTSDVWRQEDLNLVQEVSETVMWSQPDKLERVLAAH